MLPKRHRTRLWAIALGAVALAACGGPPAPGAPQAQAPARRRAEPPVVAEPAAPAARTCAARAQATTIAVRSAAPAGAIGFDSFAVASRRDGESDVPVLVGLGDDGRLVEHPLAYAPLRTSIQGATLHLLGTTKDRGAFVLGAVDLADPAAPRVLADVTVADVPAGMVSGFASDGVRAVVSALGATPSGNVWTTYVVDRATGRVLEAMRDTTIDDASYCDGAACLLVVRDQRERRVVLRRLPHGGGAGADVPVGDFPGSKHHRVPIPGGALLVRGNEGVWRGAVASIAPPFFRALPESPGPTGACPFDAGLGGRFPGVVACPAPDARALVRWDHAAKQLRIVESLPAAGRRRERYAPHPEGLLRVAWDAGSGLQHGPEHRGVRRYHLQWTFDGGEASLLTPGGAGWVERDRVDLPLQGAHGDFSRGYEPVLLARGPHAAVLLASDGYGDPAHLLPLRGPCP